MKALFIFLICPLISWSQPKLYSSSFYVVSKMNVSKTGYVGQREIDEKNYITLDGDQVKILCKSCASGEKVITYIVSDKEEKDDETTDKNGVSVMIFKAYTASLDEISITVTMKEGKVIAFGLADGKSFVLFQGIKEVKQ